jgi:hypothetical protein
MKKTIHKPIKRRLLTLALAAVLMCTPVSPVMAVKSGQAAGNYYYTDIVTTLWDVRVNAINIGGRTLLDAESLAHYGFEVTWHGDTRRLELVYSGMATDTAAQDGSLLDMASGKPGRIAGRYYQTDIVTLLNGTPIESYNIGGRTFITAENMAEYGFAVTWNPEARMLSISLPGDVRPDVCKPWGTNIYSSSGAAGDKTLDYVYLAAERDRNNPDNDGWYTTWGSGYDALSNVMLSRNAQADVTFGFSIYQYIGLEAMGGLIGRLNEVVCYKYGAYIRQPEDVRAALNKLLQIYINGAPVAISELLYSQGNGHADYTLVLDTDGSLEKDGVNSVALLLNVPESVRADIKLPPLTTELSAYDAAIKSIREGSGYVSFWSYEADGCMLDYSAQSGATRDTVYHFCIISKADGNVVDLLGKSGLAAVTVTHPPLSAISVSGDGKTLYFSCKAGSDMYYFKADTATGTVVKTNEKLPPVKVLLSSLPADNIILSGEKAGMYDASGHYDAVELTINGMTKHYAWCNVKDDVWPPRLTLADLNNDGQKELTVVLITAVGQGKHITEVHVLNPETFAEYPVESYQDIFDAHVVTEASPDAYKIIVDGKVLVINKYQLFTPTERLYDNVIFGNVLVYEVADNALLLKIDAQVSPAELVQTLFVRYVFQDNKFIAASVEFG